MSHKAKINKVTASEDEGFWQSSFLFQIDSPSKRFLAFNLWMPGG